VQKEVLEKYPSLPIQVYSIWFSMLPWDSPLAFPSAQKTMSDPRVTHFWDKEKIAGRWFKQNVTPDYQGKVIWDVYYLYGPEAEWGSTPQPLLIWGRTIMGKSQELSQEISRLAGEKIENRSARLRSRYCNGFVSKRELELILLPAFERSLLQGIYLPQPSAPGP